MNEDWRKKHGETISDFLHYLNKRSNDYVLKGGTALMMCYGLDRFSEDIDLDCAHSKAIADIAKDFCEDKGFNLRIAKDTDTVKRYMIDYGGEKDGEIKKLKVEVSYRRKSISEKECTNINGISVYTLDTIGTMKANAYSSRDKLRDLYDITFIGNNYWDKLSEATKNIIKSCIEYKGIEQFDYLVSQQEDELIDPDKLANDFLALYDKLDLLITDEERAAISENKNVEVIQERNMSVYSFGMGKSLREWEASIAKRKNATSEKGSNALDQEKKTDIHRGKIVE